MVFHHCGPWVLPVVSRGSACLPLALVPGRHSLANAFLVCLGGATLTWVWCRLADAHDGE